MNTKTTDGSTARPWQQQGCSVYQADSWLEGHNYGGKFVVGIESAEAADGYLEPTEERMANAALICQAVNEHAALVRVEQVLRGCSYALAEAGKSFAIANPNAKRPNLYELHAANGFEALAALSTLRPSVGGKVKGGGL